MLKSGKSSTSACLMRMVILPTKGGISNSLTTSLYTLVMFRIDQMKRGSLLIRIMLYSIRTTKFMKVSWQGNKMAYMANLSEVGNNSSSNRVRG